MGMPAIMVSSVTYALRGQKILASYGIKAKIQRTAKTEKNGCGYSIAVTDDQAQQAEDILIRHGIKVIGHTERLGEK